MTVDPFFSDDEQEQEPNHEPVEGGETEAESHYAPQFGYETEYLDRIIRGLTSRMTLVELAPDIYEVETASGQYRVDLQGRVCECPDCHFREQVCKHLFRVILEKEYDLDPYPLWKDSPLVEDRRPVHEAAPPIVSESR